MSCALFELRHNNTPREQKTFMTQVLSTARGIFVYTLVISVRYTHRKISHLVTSRQQVVFALLVTSCQQVWNKLLTICNKLDDIIRLVARLFQQVRYSHDITILLQPCVVKLVTFLLYHDCIRLVRKTL